MKRKIIIFYPYIDQFGGIERHILSFIKSFKKRKIDYQIVCYRNKVNWKKFNNDKSITIKVIESKNFYEKIILLKKHLKKMKYIGNILSFGEKGASFLYLTGIKKFDVFYPDTPQINFILNNSRNIFFNFKRKVDLAICKLALKKAQNTIVTSNFSKKDLKEIFEINALTVYPGSHNFLNKKIFPKKTLFINNRINLISVGRLSSNRNLEWLINLIYFCKLNEINLYNKLKLNIIGDGEIKNKIIFLAKKYRINHKIIFKFKATDKYVEKTLLKSDIFLIPAVQGYGLPALEALYLNVPVVLNKSSRISEILKNNPWVQITNNNEKNFIKNSINHIKKMKSNLPKYAFLKNLPTEESFCSDVGKICKWWV